MQTVGRVHSIETFGTVDGPGIRYVVFFQGCPLRCKYCHNRDTWNVQGGKPYKAKDIVADAKKYSSFMKFSGGGLTATGGEPTLQPEFLLELFQEAKKNKLHTTLDTSGFVDIKTLDPILDYTDLVLLDIKHIDNNSFKELTGVENHKTLALAKHLNKRNIPTWIRYVLVPDLNDDVESIDRLASFVSTLGNVENIEILPYHTMGEFKWEEMGYDYPLLGYRAATSEDVEKAKEIFAKHGLSTKIKAA